MNKIVSFLLLLYFVTLVDCRIDDLSGQTSSRWISLGDPFGFEKNGLLTVNLTINPNGDYKYLVLMGSSDWKHTYKTSTPCLIPSLFRYEFREDILLNYTIPQTDFYRLILLNCPTKETTYQSNVIYMNPNNRQLSLELYPLEPFLPPLIIAWALFFFAVLYFTIRQRKRVTPLHLILFVLAAFKLVQISSELFMFISASESGVSTLGDQRFLGVFYSITITGLLVLVIITSSGWYITSPNLTSSQKQLFWVGSLAYFISQLLYALCQDPTLCFVYKFLYQVTGFLVSYAAIFMTNRHIDKLKTQLLDTETLSLSQLLKEKYPKLRLFKRYRICYAIYLVVPIILEFLEIIVIRWQQLWMVVIINEILYIGIYGCLAFSFLPYAPWLSEVPRAPIGQEDETQLQMQPLNRQEQETESHHSGEGAEDSPEVVEEQRLLFNNDEDEDDL